MGAISDQGTFKMSLVVGKNRQIMMEGGCAKQQIKVRDQFTSSAQIGTNFSKSFYDRVIERQQCEWRKKLAKGYEMGLWIVVGKGHIIDFSHRDKTDGHLVWMDALVEGIRFLESSKKLYKPIGIKKIGHKNLQSAGRTRPLFAPPMNISNQFVCIKITPTAKGHSYFFPFLCVLRNGR